MGAECRNKKLFEGNLASIAIDLGGHLPSAESTGIAAVAAAGLNTGPVLQLNLVAILNIDRGDGEGKVLCTLTLFQIKFRVGNRDILLGLVLLGLTAGHSKLKALTGHIQRNLFGGALDVDGAGKLIARISRCLISISGIGALIGLEGAHQLQGAADFTGLLVLILTTAGQQAGTSHSHSSGGAVLQERAAIEF